MTSSQEQIEKIAAIVALLDNHLEPGPATNRRRQPRIAIRIPLVIALLTSTGAMPVDVFLRNISLSGVAFVSRRMFREDERIALSLQLPKLPTKQVLARITFSRYVRSGLYEMGAEFLQCVSSTTAETAQGTPLARIPSQWLLSAGQGRVTSPASAPAAATPAAAPSPN